MTGRGEQVLGTVMCIFLVPPLFLGAVMLLGVLVEGVGEYKVEHERCLKHATTGYEIEQCR